MKQDEINRRRPVWLAISDFYLDTDLNKEEIISIQKTFIKSGYTLTEIKEIDFYEVRPIVSSNLRSITGTWSGFDKDWLWKEIEKRTFNKRSSNFLVSFRKKLFYKSRFNYWYRYKKVFSEIH